MPRFISSLPIVSRRALHFIKSTSGAGVEGLQLTGRKLKAYFSSNHFEEDLDQVIDFLHVHNPKVRRDFNHIANRNLRIAEKSRYLKEQSALFIGLTATAGMEIGSYLGPAGATKGLAIGTAAGVLVVTVVAGSVVIKRISASSGATVIMV